MVVEVNEQHVSYETGDEPCRRFHYLLESGRHEQSIPYYASRSGGEL
jgi:hypothetical protein